MITSGSGYIDVGSLLEILLWVILNWLLK